MLAIRGALGSETTNYMVFDPAVGPWRTVSLSLFGGYETDGTFRYFTEIFSPIYDFNAADATARFPTGVPIKLRLLKPEYFSSTGDPFLPFEYKFPYFAADGLDGLGAGPGLDQPWRLIELNLSNVPFTEIRVANNGLQLLDVSGNNTLLHLDCSLNNLTDATFNMADSGFLYEEQGEMVRAMDVLRARSNELTAAPFIGQTRSSIYRDFDVANNRIPVIVVSGSAPERFDASNQFPDDSAQGLTSLSFADGFNRPSFWYVQNNRLSSLDVGNVDVTGSGWGAIKVLDCSNNLISELLFPDGPPPANYWDRGTTPGGYRLASLNVAGNQLSVLDTRYVDTLIDLVVSNNSALSSLTLAPNTVVTYDANYSDVNVLWGEQGNSVPDAITGEWASAPRNNTISNDSFFYRHTRGVRRLIARDCPLLTEVSSTAAFTTALLAIRELDISGSGVSTLPVGGAFPIFGFASPGGAPNFATYVPVAGGFRLSGSVPAGASGATPGTSYQTLAQNYMYGASRFAVSFRNLTNTSQPPPGFEHPRSRVGYMLHSALRESNNVTTYYFNVTDRHDLEQQSPTGISLTGMSGGQVAIYSIAGMPFLETFTAENCPSLTSASLVGCPLLKTVIIKNCPLLGSSDTAAVRSVLPGRAYNDDRWGGVSGQIIHLEIEDCPNVQWVSREQAPFSRLTFDRLSIRSIQGVQIRVGRAAQFSDDGAGGGVSGGVICRNGVWLTNNPQMSSFDIETFLSRLGVWSFSPSFPSDSNVVSLAGTPYPLSRKATFYDPRKATAQANGWQVIDPTFI